MIDCVLQDTAIIVTPRHCAIWPKFKAKNLMPTYWKG